jgi:hypothetical protein
VSIYLVISGLRLDSSQLASPPPSQGLEQESNTLAQHRLKLQRQISSFVIQAPFFRIPFQSYMLCIIFIIIFLTGVRLSSLGTAATTSLLHQPKMIDDGDCGEIGGMKISTGNRSTRRKPTTTNLT